MLEVGVMLSRRWRAPATAYANCADLTLDSGAPGWGDKGLAPAASPFSLAYIEIHRVLWEL